LKKEFEALLKMAVFLSALLHFFFQYHMPG